jgi:LysR family transcriptional regulator, benzoate and cis,cis-muconate-responsive activator of ben and cat genes
MELRQLRAFVTVATLGHFGQAAERLNLTQPSLTQRVQALERELGVQLFERNPRKVVLTSAGKLLLPRAQMLVQLDDEALREIKDFRAGITGRLAIAYQAAGDSSLAGSILAEYRRRFPAVDVETSAGPSGQNLLRLLDHSADAAFALMAGSRPKGIATVMIRSEEIVLAMRADHPLAQQERVPAASLRGVGLGMPPKAVNPDMFAELTSWLETRSGGRLNVVSEEPTDLAIETLAKSGRAVVVAVRRYVATLPDNGLIYKSLSPALLVELVVAYREEDDSPTLANLLEVVREVASAQRSPVPDDSERLGSR